MHAVQAAQSGRSDERFSERKRYRLGRVDPIARERPYRSGWVDRPIDLTFVVGFPGFNHIPVMSRRRRRATGPRRASESALPSGVSTMASGSYRTTSSEGFGGAQMKLSGRGCEAPFRDLASS